MTTEMLKQLEALSIERRPEACLGCGFEKGCSLHGCAVIKTAVTALCAATDANEALTLDELRGMDGEPVYISGLDVWVLVNTDSGVPVFVFRDGGVVSSSDCYEVDYFAYRRPPEGGME